MALTDKEQADLLQLTRENRLILAQLQADRRHHGSGYGWLKALAEKLGVDRNRAVAHDWFRAENRRWGGLIRQLGLKAD